MSRKRSRLTVSGSALALCVLLCAAPVLAGDWKMLPEDVDAVFHFDMAALLRSELYGSIVEAYGSQIRNPTGPYMDFVEASGFDIENDLKTVTFGAAGQADDPDGPIYVIVTGEFEMDKVTAYAKDSGKVRTGSYGDLTTYVPLDLETDGPPPTIAFLDEHTLILATTPDFPKLVESVRGSGLIADGSALGSMLAAARGQFYLAVELPPPSAENDALQGSTGNGLGRVVSQLQSSQAGPLRNLRTLLATLDAGAGLDMAVHASTDSAENGQLVYDMLNGYLMMGRSMVAQQNPQAAGILENLKLDRSGANVEISLSMSSEQIHQALEQTEEPQPAGP